ncbi:unnamed protein product, partial [Urochloa humidicola]
SSLLSFRLHPSRAWHTRRLPFSFLLTPGSAAAAMQMAAAAAPTDAPAAAAAVAAAPHHHPHAHAAAAAGAPPHPHAHGPHPHHHMPQPRWVVIPYPPPHHPMVAAPPPPPPQFVKHFAPPASVTPPPPPSAGSGGNGGEDNRTIWVGDLQYWMDENYLHSCFGPSGEVVTIKVIRNRHSGVSEGYGFVEFYSHASAEKALQNFSGHVMPNTDRAFKLNWASYSRSRGYGFVRFGDDNDKTHAMTEMNGVYCSTRPIRVGPATPRRSQGDSGSSPPRQSDSDSTNRTVYVGGLDPNVSEEELRKAFAKYGDLASVKIPVGKQCGFVQFVNRADAEEALQGLNGVTIGKQAVRLSWGRSPASKQSRGDSGHRRNGNGMYYGTPFYGGYGYASPVPHPNMYAAAYGAYPYYGNQQLVS